MQIELTMGFEELSEQLNARGEDKIWKENGEANRQEEGGGCYRQFKKNTGPKAFPNNG